MVWQNALEIYPALYRAGVSCDLLAADLCRGHASVLLFDHPDDLPFGAAAFSHAVCSEKDFADSSINLGQAGGGRSSFLVVLHDIESLSKLN